MVSERLVTHFPDRTRKSLPNKILFYYHCEYFIIFIFHVVWEKEELDQLGVSQF